MSCTITPLSPAIGALATGIDLSRTVDPATAKMLWEAFNEHVILLVRDQRLTEDQLADAASWLGPLGKRGRPSTVLREGNQYITKVSNIRENGKLIGSLPDGEMQFHADNCFKELPNRASFLYAVEIPSKGGNTLFANLYKAYDLVPSALRARIEGLRVLQRYDYSTFEKDVRAAGISNVAQCSQPIVLTHPVTRRCALFVNRLMTARIEGIPERESEALLAELFDITEDPSVVYEHVWRPGDFLAWDNLSSNHARTDFSASERRLLLRGTTVGDWRPVA